MELFRAYSDSSQGHNSKDLFAPGAAVSHRSITDYTAPSTSSIDLAQELVDALNWKKNKPSIFVFFTASLLFATQVARYRKQKGEENVKITCFNTKTARTPAGKPVRFWSVGELIKEYGINITNKDGSLRDYADVYVAMDCVVPGRGALTASFDQMEEAGLYRLYPALAEAYRSRRPRLALVTQDLREFQFQEEKSFTTGHINAAAQVAAAFKIPGASGALDVPSNIFIHVLALRQRRVHDVILTSWLQNCSTEVVELEDMEELPVANFLRGSPEIEQYRELKSVIGNRQIHATSLNHNIDVSKAAQEQELAEWNVWRRSHIDQQRDARQERPDYVPKHGSRKRIRRDREDSESSQEGGRQPYKRSKRDWLPTEEYRAQRDEYRANRDASRAPRTEVRQYSFTGKNDHDTAFKMPGFETSLFDLRGQHGHSERRRKTDSLKRGCWW